MRGSRTAALSIVTLAGTAMMLTGCSGGGADSTSADDSSGARAGAFLPEASGDLAMQDGQSAGQPKSAGGLLTDVTGERSVIATAEMTLRSEDVTSTVDAIELLAASAGGFVAGRDVQSNPDDPSKTRATILIRVPTDKIDSVIDRVSAEGDVVRVTSDEQDVTETVVDVDSRVKSAEASVERIRALLSEATTIGEVVRIESELSRREADLESLLAQQRSLAEQTALATLTVTVLAPDAVGPAPEEDTGFLAGLERGWDALVSVVVVALTTVGVLLPFLVVALLVLGPLAAAWRHRRSSTTSPDQPAKEREAEPVSPIS